MSVENSSPNTGTVSNNVFADISFEDAAEYFCHKFREQADKARDAFCEFARKLFKMACKDSKHNADLINALNEGGEFRIAFRKPGETEWTRVYFREEELLRLLAIDEVFARQGEIMQTLCSFLGGESLKIRV